ncbi:MAG TPA: KpsF/GutQ family sugar-phosphate isomerase [Deltaproteobacteria bacterium]|nr:KpsF/GutQ family sugar-phosphate isomerase [Deltaproteobacteria bacterium]
MVRCAERVLDVEAEAVRGLKQRLDDGFVRAVELILEATGKVVVTGMGKSGHVCQKIAATLASTGTSAVFLHPAEGLHGDLGVLMKNDVVIAVSNSGETEEILGILPLIKRLGIKLIAMTGRRDSTLARHGEVVLDVAVKEEACPLGLAPTASTTACLAMGDALAVALLERRGFRAEDFAALHPAGSLGRKLMAVRELMHSGEAMPRVGPDTPMKEAIIEMTAKRLGVTGVFDGERLVGVITDGDLRRCVERGAELLELRAAEVMTSAPKVIGPDDLAESALRKMEDHSITSLFVVEDGRAVGIVHLHDLIRAGVI